jgi:hypothetical protein
MNTKLGKLLILIVPVFILGGCADALNDNPVSPQKMEQIRQK